MNGNLVYVIAGSAALGLFVLFVAVRGLWNLGQVRIQSRLPKAEVKEEAGILRRRKPTDWSTRMDLAFDKLVEQTGLDLKPDQALGWTILAGAVLATAAYFVKDEFWFCALAFLLGLCATLAVLYIYRIGYINKLQDQLPDAIYLLSRCLRAGLSLEQSIELVGKESVQPLASEFKRCDQQIKLGLPISLALENMARELRMLDLNALASTVAVFEATGGNLPMLLDRLAASARDRASMRAYFRSATAMARVAIVPVALAVPGILIAYLVIEPEYVVAFAQTRNGQIMMIGGVILEIIGLMWIYRLLRFEY